MRQANGYPTLPVYPSLSMHLPHVHGLSIRSVLASCRVMRSLGGGQSVPCPISSYVLYNAGA